MGVKGEDLTDFTYLELGKKTAKTNKHHLLSTQKPLGRCLYWTQKLTNTIYTFIVKFDHESFFWPDYRLRFRPKKREIV